VHGFAAHGGVYGHSYYGAHGYYHGYHPGYPGYPVHPWYPYHYCCAYGGWWGAWWWGPGWWGVGVYVPVLPYYYTTFWYNGYPYYYADNSYYVWNGDAGEYEQVSPPNGMQPGAAGGGDAATGADLFAYPKGGQSEEQQARDRDECRRWAQQAMTEASGPGAAPPGAGGQSGAPAEPAGAPPNAAPPPMPGASGAPSGNAPALSHESYLRAEAACLEARNYAVR
jgi:hypothetical protein